jgi:hypothetical protein
MYSTGRTGVMNLCTSALHFYVNYYNINLIYCNQGYRLLELNSKCSALSYYHKFFALWNCYSTNLGGSAGCGTAELWPLSQAVSIPSVLCPLPPPTRPRDRNYSSKNSVSKQTQNFWMKYISGYIKHTNIHRCVERYIYIYIYIIFLKWGDVRTCGQIV